MTGDREVQKASLVAPVLEEVEGEVVLGIDDPDEEEAISLQLGHRQRHNVCISQLAVAQRHPCTSTSASVC